MSNTLYQKITPALIQKYKRQGYTGADLHFHTEYSMDAISRIENVLHLAKKKQIGFAVTDHNQIGGALKAVSLSKQRKDNTLIIPAVEATCSEGVHLIYYFYSAGELAEWYKKELQRHMHHNPFFASIATTELMENSRCYNAVLCTPHPFAPGITGFHKIKTQKKTLRHVQLVEVLNAFNLHSMNIRAEEWAAEIKRGYTAGSDGHTTPELGTAVTFGFGETREEFLHSLLKKQSIAAGKEESLFHKALISVLKEETYVKKAKEHHEAFQLIHNQYRTEASYLKKKHEHERTALLHYFRIHHF